MRGREILNEMAAGIKAAQANQPSLGAEAQGWFREGREDLWNNLIPAFPGSLPLTREMGAPGTPTPGGVDRQLQAETAEQQPKETKSPEIEPELG